MLSKSLMHSLLPTTDIKKLQQCRMFGPRCGKGKQQSKHCFRTKAEVSTPTTESFFNPMYRKLTCTVASGNMMTRQSRLTLTQPCMDGGEMPSIKRWNRHRLTPTGVWHLVHPMFMFSCDDVLYTIIRGVRK